jgi:hypothetical protein
MRIIDALHTCGQILEASAESINALVVRGRRIVVRRCIEQRQFSTLLLELLLLLLMLLGSHSLIELFGEVVVFLTGASICGACRLGQT